MPQYTTSQEAMLAGARTMGQAANEIQGQLATLRREVDTMMGGWRGDAASSFRQVHDTFEAQGTKINAALHDMHAALLATHRIYGNQEHAQTRTLTGIAGQMSG